MKLAYRGEKKHFSKSENITLNMFKKGDTLQMRTNAILKKEIVRQIKLFCFNHLV